MSRGSMARWLRRAIATVRAIAAGTLVGALLVTGLSAVPASALAQQPTFDHLATGYLLTGAHENVRCETCHIKGIFKGTPRECGVCHIQSNPRGAVAKPSDHIQTTEACSVCHTTASFVAAMFTHATATPGSCASCHNGVRAAGKRAGHVPTTASCDQCHSTIAFAPVLKFDHTALGRSIPTSLDQGFTNCVSCHDGRLAVGKPANHIPAPNPAQCGTCHIASTLNGFASFAGGQMDHAGITSGCVNCHGPTVTGSTFAGITSIVVMPPTSPPGASSHIPSSTACEACHLANTPGWLVPANAPRNPPGTVFGLPAPTAAQIHAGVNGGCNACHDTNSVWMGMSAYPIAPSVLTSGAQYTGFQTRPKATAGTFNVADPTHPSVGDCSQCHSGTTSFAAKDKPDNHIPISPTAQCTACHTTPGDFKTLPTLANIHANAPSTSANCAQCHGAAAASFAIPANNFSIVGLPGNHLPTSASCEVCHVGAGSSITATPVGNGAKFSGSRMSHSGITNNCVACHGPTITGSSFAGVAKIIVMPATNPMGASSHIPSSTACESCHLGTLANVAGLVPASASANVPGSAFATPAPTTAQIHTGVSGGCNACHDTNSVWMGMSAYPIAPTVKTSGAQYTGFQTRPKAAAGTYNVADAAHPATGDCSQCHSGTNYFSAQDKPSNHIPTAATAQCNSCHTTSDYATMPTLANIHANAPSTSANCAQCHGAAAASFAIPANNFSIVGLPGNHLPTSASCEVCHVGAGSSITATPVGNGAKFSGSRMSHSGITNNCVACHGPTITGSSFAGVAKIIVMPATNPMGASSHIPSSTACESCHLGTLANVAGLVPASASANVPGSAFATPAPTTAQIHTGVSGGCNACHDTNSVWMGMSAYPIAPTVKTSGAQYTGFQTRPKAAAGTYNVADAAHPATGDCSQCHSGTNYFSAQDKPSNHIPTAATAQCNSCHTTSDYATMPTLANIHANAPSTSANCAQCHGAAAASFAIPANNFSIVGLPGNHLPTSASCEVCHVGAGSSITATPVGNGAKFSGSRMSHSGITNNCVACHGPTITGSSFAGVAKIIVMPATNPMGASSHIPSSTACESCHLGTLANVAGLVPASASANVPGSAFATPAPTTAQIHTGVSGGCNACHDTNSVWMGMSAYPIAPTVKTSGAQYTGFQTRPKAAAGTYNVADAAHPATGDCSQCHSGTNYFSAQDKPSNHIPTAATAQCNSCHTTSDYAVMPTLANIHANAPSTSANCAQCHGAAAASFAIPANNFSIVGLPGNHLPTSASCEVCHVGAGSSITATPVGNGAKFSGSRMSHSGITNNCVACHGPTITGSSFAGVAKIIVMPATNPMGASSHIPSSTACESCHLGTLANVAGLVPASASANVPGSAFATPAPTTAQIHTGVSGGCNACHDTNSVWMGMSAYPIAPTVKTSGAQYTGFQTRPKAAAGTYNVADAAHPATGDCSQCHSGTNYFSAQDKPSNHIPTAATAQCNSCHTTSDYAVMPTLANIHANAPSTSANCAQCHGAAAASFAIPANNFSIVGLPGNHLPTSASCEVCHVGAGSSITATPVGNGAKFSGSRMSHSGITNNCVACHGPTITGSSFAGVAKIIVMPATNPMGASSHIPSSTACESCHLGTLANVAGLVPASASANVPGSAFATPAPTTAQIHTGVSGGCNACHDTNSVWMGMSAYPIAPTVKTSGAQYTGFQTRPKAAAGTYNVADAAHPATGDCSQCHSGTNYFSAQDKPSNHIPTAATAQCNSCHTTSDYAVMPTLANIHANAPSTSANCAQCHGAAAASFAIPANNFSIVGLPGNHLPTSASCEVCHVGAGSSITATPVGNGAKFSGSRMSHSGITNNCVACHGPTITGSSFAGVAKIIVMPATNPMGASSHIPSSTACESCHLGTLANVAGLVPASASANVPGSAFATPAPTTAQIHTGVSGGCNACHDTNSVWMGMSAYPIAPTVKTSGAQYTGFQTRPKAAAGTYNVADAAHPATGDCSQCHSGTNYFSAQDKPSNHIPTAATAQCNSCHTTSDYAVMPTLANIHANAPSTSANCAQCHGAAAASFAIPANNFSIVGLPGNHLPTSASCEVCHVGAGSSITATPVGNGAKFSGSRMSHSGITNNCVACHGPTITGSSFAGVAKIIVMPATNPMGASSHIPSSTACESCHLGTLANVAGLVPASASANVPGSAFATPAPTTAQIHTGVSGGCNACHDTNSVWMGMSAYPIAPTVKTSGAQYTGFQTRPKAAAGTYNVADAAHPATGDCSQCHSGTNYFSAQDKPSNHIPTAATAQCNSCHTTSDYAVMPTLANIHANAPSTSANCAQCHGAAAASFAIPANNFSIVGLPGNHLPTSASCEVCHVGAGSSITATPVGNGAKFSGSRMSHSGITNNCVACHGPTITGSSFAGVAKIIVMPATNPMGASSHIPSSTACESCHLGTLANVAGLVPASASANVPGSAFATPAPTTAQIHTGVSGGCNACHDTNSVWMGMSAYPIAPTVLTSGAQYTGFQTRPKAAAGTYNVADAAHPATGDCSQCHSGTNYFSAQAKPNGHIPTQQACAICHVVAGDYSIAGLTSNMTTLHTGITSGCIACHTAGTGAGPFAGCTTQASCASPPPLTYQPKAMPLLAGGSPTAPSPSTHVPAVGIACEKCHAPAVFTSFAGMNMKGNTPAHQAVGTPCMKCHEGGPPAYTWYGVTIKTRPVGHEGRKAGQDCVSSGCHKTSYSQFSTEARVRPVMRSAVNAGRPRMVPDGLPQPAMGAVGASRVFDHQGVLPGECQTCHNGQAANGQPVKHLATRVSCDACHRTTAWIPAQFSHQGALQGQCQTCHNGSSAGGKSSGHFVTARACDACHRTIGWVPTIYSHVSALYRPLPDKTTCVSCHVTNGEIIPRQLRGAPRPKPVPVP